ncbi:MAG: amidohydrolase [Chitinophagaceae bacterium]
MKILAITAFAFLLLSFVIGKTKVDLMIINAKIYTVDKGFTVAEALVVKDGIIVETGTNVNLKKYYDAEKLIDANGKFIYPGFIDAHAHFLGYGLSLQTANLTGTDSWEAVVNKTWNFQRAKNIDPGKWITGRGWDQNDWTNKEFPNAAALDSAFPYNPVMLTRIDGHAAIANSMALAAAGIKPGDKLTGGEIILKDGKLTGLLIDNAIKLVSKMIPASGDKLTREALSDAEQKCFAAGLTSIVDCGINAYQVELIKNMQDEDSLKMRLYVMLTDNESNFTYLEKKGIIKTPRLHVRSFKVYGDGALGSRGACLLEPYTDKPGSRGFLLSNASHFDSVAQRLYKNRFQMCTHAIGDSGNRVILQTYAKYLKGKNDLRWRIEHAQVVNQNDFNWFSKYSIIPSVQPTHATSDMYWATERLGNKRVKNAYAFKKLLDQNQWIPLGTDFPVEDISPIKTFYAAVFRKDAKGWPKDGYQMENALSRKEALRGMTIWAAKSNFEEKEKGSIEKGKFADLVVLDQDLMVAPGEKILATKVVMTFVGGEMVFGK